ncbi:MAG: hypothetical protein ABSD29_12625 [Verrucomicrobiota bacterium]|jgi:hypothetical protein
MPEKYAKLFFNESIGSLMAHSLRAVFNHFYKRGIAVELLIIADTANAILPMSPTEGATSLLRTNLYSRHTKDNHQHDRVVAWIFIHKDANRHLARMCIAHEIYHLLMELNAYIDGGRSTWAQIAVNESVEKQCNDFARRFCSYHDRFNHDEKLREEYIYFPPDTFKEGVKTTSTNSQPKWPPGLSLDPAHPFHQTTPPNWL